MPTIAVEGQDIELTEGGYLANAQDWSPALAEEFAKLESVSLSEKHWDLINHLRDEFFNNNENQPNTRNLVKAMQDKWGGSLSAKDLYTLFPKDPSKQGGRIAGLPESRRKGGY